MRSLLAALALAAAGCWSNACHDAWGPSCPSAVVRADCGTASCTLDGTAVGRMTVLSLRPGQVLRIPLAVPSPAYRQIRVYARATTDAPAPPEHSVAVVLDGALGVLDTSEAGPPPSASRSWVFLVPPLSRTNTVLEIRFSGSGTQAFEFFADVIDGAQRCTVCDG